MNDTPCTIISSSHALNLPLALAFFLFFLFPLHHRYCSIVCNRYMDSDVPCEGSLTLSAGAAAAYRGAVLVILQGLRSCSLQQFQAVISQSISRLILSSDFEVRRLICDLCAHFKVF